MHWHGWSHIGSNLDRPPDDIAHTGVSAVYQDFKAPIRMKVGTSNPAKDIMKLFTHLERLKANQVVIPDYVQGMMLLNAIQMTGTM